MCETPRGPSPPFIEHELAACAWEVQSMQELCPRAVGRSEESAAESALQRSEAAFKRSKAFKEQPVQPWT